ncbi:MAG: hypothetical protein RML36_17260, partial [Anaerolineae bacterium]|nr:hypothetical protein [Anaerolineae bacterium]MDW8101224.1 hypothetical protein [Anaerolineae bacterium]
RERMERQTGDPRPRGTRSDVSMQDLKELLELIDRLGDCQLVASLLVAYGYASTFQRDEACPGQVAEDEEAEAAEPSDEDVEGTDDEE